MPVLTFLKKQVAIFCFIIFSYSIPLLAEAQQKSKGISNAWELPPIILKDLKGEEHNLYDWHGKVIMLNFWATWCGPCQLEIPDFISYQNQYADKGLQIIGIGLDDLRKLKNYARTVGINYPTLHADPELQYSLLNQWGNPYGVLPFTVIIARDGHLVFMQQGILNSQNFNTFVKPLLDK